MGAMIGARERPGLLELQFASDTDKAFYEHGESIKSRVRALYGTQTHMLKLVQPMTGFRPWIIDYFEQFPALPLWIAQGVKDPHKVGTKQAELIHRMVVDLFEERPRLKDLMRRWAIPQPLRKIHGQGLLPRHAAAARWLATLNPSLVSQVIPENPKQQRRWMNLIEWIRSQKVLGDEMRLWLVVQSRSISKAEAFDMADFALREGGFDYRWTWTQASAARDRWHGELARRDVRARFALEPDEPICRNPLPDNVRVKGFELVALRTPAAIIEEGSAMHHCVASYVHDVHRGLCSIVSIRECGKRVATLEMTPRGQCRQLRGPCNSTSFMKGLRKAVSEYELLFGEAAALHGARTLR